MAISSHLEFECRLYGDVDRPGDRRTKFERDKARIIHSSAFRRLQGKTQVMGVGEGDFHRTRLTHSIEVGQIGEGLLQTLCWKYREDADIKSWLPSNALVIASCYAHDLGHPPFGHGGERALHEKMYAYGGFEGNAQTLRIISKLEKYRKFQGINPTRRTVLSIMKYPVSYKKFEEIGTVEQSHPPKCYYSEDEDVVSWAIKPFSDGDQILFRSIGCDNKPKHKTLDASIMDCADDIAYAVHDLEDIIARHLAERTDIEASVKAAFGGNKRVGRLEDGLGAEEFSNALYKSSYDRKQIIGKLVNILITNVKLDQLDQFEHPLLRFRASFPEDLEEFLKKLKKVTYNLVTKQAKVQQLERRGQRIVQKLYEEIMSNPKELIPVESLANLSASSSANRKVCDYIAGMTDGYAEKIYHRLFSPGYGSSHDEL